jgi:hypothetical protein
MWLVLGLLLLLLLLSLVVVGVTARALVWRPAKRAIGAAKYQSERAQRLTSQISSRNSHPHGGSQTNDSRTLNKKPRQ